jgi:preprotein translocase subunit SecG
MITFLIVFLVLVCVLLISVILVQSSKGGGLSGTFGGSNVTTMFGARRTSDFLQKATIVMAVIFMLTALLMNLYIGKSSAVTESNLQKQSNSAPAPQQQQQMPEQQQPQQQQQQQPEK